MPAPSRTDLINLVTALEALGLASGGGGGGSSITDGTGTFSFNGSGFIETSGVLGGSIATDDGLGNTSFLDLTPGNIGFTSSDGTHFVQTTFSGNGQIDWILNGGNESFTLQGTTKALGFDILNGTLQTTGFASTASGTATFTATNKPGANKTSPDSWIRFQKDGTAGWIPWFAN